MFENVDKAVLVERIVATLSAELADVREAAKAAREAATHEDNQPENQYDTRALEASYLAGAQAARAEALDVAVQTLAGLDLREFDDDRPIALSALVAVEHDDGVERYFVCPNGGGVKLEHEDGPIRVVTTESPLGRAIIGKRVGDDFELTIKRNKRAYEVIAVA